MSYLTLSILVIPVCTPTANASQDSLCLGFSQFVALPRFRLDAVSCRQPRRYSSWPTTKCQLVTHQRNWIACLKQLQSSQDKEDTVFWSWRLRELASSGRIPSTRKSVQSLTRIFQKVGSEAQIQLAHALITLANTKQTAHFLVEALGSEDLTSPEETVAWSLPRLGKRVVPLLVKGLKSRNSTLRARSALALGRIAMDNGDVRPQVLKLLPSLRKVANDSDPFVRLHGLMGLRLTGSQDPLTVKVFVGALSDSHFRARIEAIGTLSTFHANVLCKQLPVLIKALKDSQDEVRLLAAEAIGSLESRGSPAVPELIKALEDRTSHVRWSAVWALGQIGGAAKDALPLLEPLLTHPNRRLQRVAAKAIKSIQTAPENSKQPNGE